MNNLGSGPILNHIHIACQRLATHKLTFVDHSGHKPMPFSLTCCLERVALDGNLVTSHNRIPNSVGEMFQ